MAPAWEDAFWFFGDEDEDGDEFGLAEDAVVDLKNPSTAGSWKVALLLQ